MSDFSARRRNMVDTQIRPSDVTKFPVISAMLSVAREAFVPRAKREAAYVGDTMDLGAGRILLDARVFAKMLDAVNVQPNEMVLHIGAGMGYGPAVLAQLAEAVVAVEEDDTLASEAQTALSDQNADAVALHTGPLADGAAAFGPYDVMILEGGVEVMPDALIAQIKEGGRICAIFMHGALGVVRIGYKLDGAMVWRDVFNAAAPVLPGFAAIPEFAL